MYIPRELEKAINPFLRRPEIVAIVGPRQSGKTTLLTRLASQLKKRKKRVEFMSFEERKNLKLFENIEDFKNYYKEADIVILDEFQYAKEGGKKLKYLFDTTKTKYIISGSSSLELMFQTGKYLVGRIVTFSLLPFSFTEFLLAKDRHLFQIYVGKNPYGQEINRRLLMYFEDYLIFGGYPKVVLTSSKEEKEKLLESVVENYLIRDIQSLLQLSTEDNLIQLAKLLAGQIGSLVNYQELSTSTSLSYKELIKHLHILRKTFIVDFVGPYFRNRRTELVKNPKIYFYDSGFRNYLLEDFRSFDQRQDIGHLVENWVFTILRKDLSEGRKINFWRTKSGAEIDFIIEKNAALIPIEVKYSPHATPGKSLYSFIKKYEPNFAYVLTKNETKSILINKTTVLFQPVYTFLSNPTNFPI